MRTEKQRIANKRNWVSGFILKSFSVQLETYKKSFPLLEKDFELVRQKTLELEQKVKETEQVVPYKY